MSEQPTQNADALRDFIGRNELKQADAAEALGVHSTTICGWLKEDRIPDYAAKTLELFEELGRARANLAEAKRTTNKSIVLSASRADIETFIEPICERFEIQTLDLTDLLS